MSGGAAVADASPLASAEPVPELPTGILAWTTTRHAGSFGLSSSEPVARVTARWTGLLDELGRLGVHRLGTATQVHGAEIVRHGEGWRGWLRLSGIDGHISATPGTAMAVTIADCTPVFISHPRGVAAALHAGWRGTASRILDVGLDAMTELGCPPDECHVHLGPSICGPCYEVGPEVLEAVTGRPATAKGFLDVRAILADQASIRGVKELSISPSCTRHHGDRFFSHRGGDEGRQLGIIAIPHR